MKTRLFKYIEIFITKKWKFSHYKKNLIFSYFYSKHRLQALVRTASSRHANEYPQSMFLSRNKKNNLYPCNPLFYNIKVGFKGVKLYRYGFVMHLNQMLKTRFCDDLPPVKTTERLLLWNPLVSCHKSSCEDFWRGFVGIFFRWPNYNCLLCNPL